MTSIAANLSDEIDVDELIEMRKLQRGVTSTPEGGAGIEANAIKCADTKNHDRREDESLNDSATAVGRSGTSRSGTDIEVGLNKSELVIEWSDVKCMYPGSARGNRESSTTLSNASGNLKTRELTAIMGPSGSGKSTLLDILSGLKTTGNVTGTIRIFGQEVTDMKQASILLRNATSFVPQDVAFFPMQTPEEAVRFVARLQNKNNEDSSLEKCHKLLRDVGLTKPELYTRPIGGDLAGGLSIRGLSGGERKRLALACALAMNPQLIMLDEITSGLDSENALATIQLVKEVCVTRNVAAAVVIHQPDGYIFQEFDRLVLLAGGACVFSDEVGHLGQLYRDQFKVKMPDSPHEVPLDLMRRLGKIDPLAYPAIEWEDSSGGREVIVAYQKKKENVPFTRKLLVVLGRNMTNHYLRNLTNLGARLFAYTACSIMDGAIFWGVGNNRNGTIIGALSFITLISYLLPFATMPVFVHEKKFFIMERSLGLYSPWIYCISQALLEMCVVIMASILEASVIIPMIGLWNPTQTKAESFFTILCALVASGLAGSSLILLSAIMMPSQDLAFLFGSSVTTFWLGVSGGFVPLTAIEDWISWLQWFSPCKYSMNALATGVLGGTDEEFILEHVGLNRPSSIAANIGILLVFYLFFALGTMVALSKQTSRR